MTCCREAIGLTRGRDNLEAAHLLATLGFVEVDDHHYRRGSVCVRRRRGVLGHRPSERDPATADQWLETDGGRLGSTPSAAGRAQLAKVVLDATGSDVVSHGIRRPEELVYRHLAWQRVLQDERAR